MSRLWQIFSCNFFGGGGRISESNIPSFDIGKVIDILQVWLSLHFKPDDYLQFVNISFDKIKSYLM